MPYIKIRGGDRDDSDLIDVADITIITGAYHLETGDTGFDARGGVNDDGRIQVRDLVLSASNFNRASTATWSWS